MPVVERVKIFPIPTFRIPLILPKSATSFTFTGQVGECCLGKEEGHLCSNCLKSLISHHLSYVPSEIKQKKCFTMKSFQKGGLKIRSFMNQVRNQEIRNSVFETRIILLHWCCAFSRGQATLTGFVYHCICLSISRCGKRTRI